MNQKLEARCTHPWVLLLGTTSRIGLRLKKYQTIILGLLIWMFSQL
jgi:hypothetical protein